VYRRSSFEVSEDRNVTGTEVGEPEGIAALAVLGARGAQHD
jgi:hypothetical protein